MIAFSGRQVAPSIVSINRRVDKPANALIQQTTHEFHIQQVHNTLYKMYRRVHLGPTDTSRRCTSMMCTARFDTWQLCRIPRTRRRIGDRAFSVTAARAWSRLPTGLKQLQSTDSFRRQLKTFLFQTVYGH